MYPLEVKALSKHFGGIRAIEEISFHTTDRTILSIIGPNGAGKTTLFNCLTGFMKPTKGSIVFSGQKISGLSADKINRLGIARTFQNIRLFKDMTVLENVMVAQHTKIRSGFFSAIFHPPLFKREEKTVREKGYEYLELLGLGPHAGKISGGMPYGAQRKLEIARALATEASLLLFDEPTAGMNPMETDEMMRTIRNLKELDKTVIIIEHDMPVIMNLCERIVVLDHGDKIAEGKPEEIKKNELVLKAYFGG